MLTIWRFHRKTPQDHITQHHSKIKVNEDSMKAVWTMQGGIIQITQSEKCARHSNLSSAIIFNSFFLLISNVWPVYIEIKCPIGIRQGYSTKEPYTSCWLCSVYYVSSPNANSYIPIGKCILN